MNTAIVTSENKYNNIPAFEKLVKNTTNQADFVKAVMELTKTDSTTRQVVDTFDNAGLHSEEFLTNVGILTTSIFLALGHNRSIDILGMSVGDYVTSSRPASLLGTYRDLGRREVSKQIAQEIVGDNRAVGFQLELVPKGASATYSLKILQLADSKVDRATLRKESDEQLAKELSLLVANTEEGADPIATQAAKAEIRKGRKWKPAYVARYIRG